MDKETLCEYRELLLLSQYYNKIEPVPAKQKQVKERLLYIELSLTSKEIIENTRLAFSVK